MSIVAQKVIKRLREEQPELLKDIPAAELKEFDLDKLDPEMLPSEMKALAEQIARKRMTASGLSREESQALLRRTGHKK